MFESLGFVETTSREASVWLGLMVGFLFGILAERTKFCFRRSLVGEDRREAMGVWLMALAVAVLGTQAAVALGWISFAEHRFISPSLPVLAIGLGGLFFGASSSCLGDQDQDGIDDLCGSKFPAVSEWGLIVMTLLLLVGIKICFARTRPGSRAGQEA